MKNLMKPTLQSFDVRWPAVVLLTATFVLLPGCKKAAEPEALVTVQAEQPEHGSISESITADAVLAPIAQAAIEPKISAPVKKFYVERGQRVHSGELLVLLENAEPLADRVGR